MFVNDLAVISCRQMDRFVAWETSYEIEDMLTKYLRIDIADAHQRKPWIVGNKLQKLLAMETSIFNLSYKANNLLVFARHPGELSVINTVPNLTRRFGRIFGYVFDSYFHAGFSKATAKYDHVFVTGTDDAEFVQRAYGISSSVLRQGIDTIRWYSNRVERSIDLIGFGRTPESYHRAFQSAFHNGRSDLLYLHSPIGSLRGAGVHEERPMFIKLLQRAKLCLAFHMFVEPMGDRPRSMMVTTRWLEALAAGCLPVGRRPTGEMADDMLSWPQSTFELSENPTMAAQEISELAKDECALIERRRVNLAEVRVRHDVRLRVQEMLKIMGVSVPKALLEDICQLQIS